MLLKSFQLLKIRKVVPGVCQVSVADSEEDEHLTASSKEGAGPAFRLHSGGLGPEGKKMHLCQKSSIAKRRTQPFVPHIESAASVSLQRQ